MKNGLFLASVANSASEVELNRKVSSCFNLLLFAFVDKDVGRQDQGLIEVHCPIVQVHLLIFQNHVAKLEEALVGFLVVGALNRERFGFEGYLQAVQYLDFLYINELID